MLSELFKNLSSLLNKRQVVQLSDIFFGLFAISGAVSICHISRLSGIAYRTLQRFYACYHDWNAIRFQLYINGVVRPEPDTTILTVDEVVEDKCGSHTFGISWFYGGLYQKVVKGIAALQISIVHTKTGKSYPLAAVQMQKSEADIVRAKARKAKREDLKKRKAAAKAKGIPFVGKKRGSKKGSKRKSKKQEQHVDAQQSMLFRYVKQLLTIVLNFFVQHQRTAPKYLVGDGSFGNQNYIALAKTMKIDLISKLKKTACLTLAFTGTPPPGKPGPKTTYGDIINLEQIPKRFLVHSQQEPDGTKNNIYQVQCYNRKVSKELLNVVIIESVQAVKKAKNRVLLFSTNLEIKPEDLIKYYGLRYTIEIDFRDAKQYFGLRDFKNIKEQQVNNAIQIAITGKLVAQICADQLEQQSITGKCSIRDVKTYFRTQYYLQQFINLIPNDLDKLLIQQNINKIVQKETIQLKYAA